MFEPSHCQKIQQGQVGVIPTDTVYGLVASAQNQAAVKRVYQIKGRNFDKRCIILLSSAPELEQFGIANSLRSKMKRKWANSDPTSLEVPVDQSTPNYLRHGFSKMSFRIPKHFPELVELLKCTGPVIGPSANPQGLPPATTSQMASEYFGDQVDFYIDGGKRNAKPSRLIAFGDNGVGNIIRS